ncbi:MAG: hypothetical protein Q8R57_05065 [Bacteroidota bacterium]|nr:hypothetical protein [Bacteroidota bacterium]
MKNKVSNIDSMEKQIEKLKLIRKVETPEAVWDLLAVRLIKAQSMRLPVYYTYLAAACVLLLLSVNITLLLKPSSEANLLEVLLLNPSNMLYHD